MYNRPSSQRIKDAIKGVGSPMLDALGVFDRSIERVRADGSVWTILMYHRVIEDAADDPFGLGMCVRLPHFEQQVDYFKQHFHVLSVDEAVQRIGRGEPLPPATLSITFDDGYLDNLNVAQPVLERLGLPWSLYVTTGDLDTGRSFWWDRAIRCIALTRAARLDADRLPHDLGLTNLPLQGMTRWMTLTTLLEALWRTPIEVSLQVVDALERQLIPNARPADGPQAPRMSSAQVRELADRGVEIGAHTVRHPNLNLLSADGVAAEMAQSRRVLEALLDRPVPGFVYPGGRMNADVVEQARLGGFRYALSTVPTLNVLPCDLHALGRIGMPDAGVADFKRSLHAIGRRSLSRPMPAGADRAGGGALTPRSSKC